MWLDSWLPTNVSIHPNISWLCSGEKARTVMSTETNNLRRTRTQVQHEEAFEIIGLLSTNLSRSPLESDGRG